MADPSLLRENQLYLLTTPSTPQQQFLHLFAHRHLFTHRMYHKNIGQVGEYLRGTMANHSLSLAYTAFRILNRLEVGAGDPLKAMVDEWVDFYPSLRGKNRFLFNEMVLMHNENRLLPTYSIFMQFVDLISTDLMKLLKPALPTA